MTTSIETIKAVADVAQMLAASGYYVMGITFTTVPQIHLGNPDGLPLPAEVESITETELYFHHYAHIGGVEITWLVEKIKVAA